MKKQVLLQQQQVFSPYRPVDQVSMRRHRVQNKYTINFNKKIQEAMPRAGLSCKGKALSSYNLSVCFADSSPSRGASGETVHFAGTAKASPTRGGGSASALTERLYKGKPALCSKARPFAPYRASGVQWKVTRPAKGSPSGRAGERMRD